MSNIIKVSILGVAILIGGIIFIKDVLAKENKYIKIIAQEPVSASIGRKKLGVEVVDFKTKSEEILEENNKRRLDIYKSRLALSVFREGEQNILVTGYSSTPDQCWGDPFQTASGTRVHRGTMACPPQYPFGTKIEIENVGTFICEDRGGAIKGSHFDMWFTSRGEALNWGKRVMLAKISR
jgi:3D (Asp-Asp-Asp) domain-containing protein